MKKVTKTHDVYSFNELDEKGKERALNDEIEFFLETADWGDNNEPLDIAADAIVAAEKNRTPWFAGSILWENNENEIRESCIERGEHYLKTGEFFSE